MAVAEGLEVLNSSGLVVVIQFENHVANFVATLGDREEYFGSTVGILGK